MAKRKRSSELNERPPTFTKQEEDSLDDSEDHCSDPHMHQERRSRHSMLKQNGLYPFPTPVWPMPVGKQEISSNKRRYIAPPISKDEASGEGRRYSEQQSVPPRGPRSMLSRLLSGVAKSQMNTNTNCNSASTIEEKSAPHRYRSYQDQEERIRELEQKLKLSEQSNKACEKELAKGPGDRAAGLLQKMKLNEDGPVKGGLRALDQEKKLQAMDSDLLISLLEWASQVRKEGGTSTKASPAPDLMTLLCDWISHTKREGRWEPNINLLMSSIAWISEMNNGRSAGGNRRDTALVSALCKWVTERGGIE